MNTIPIQKAERLTALGDAVVFEWVTEGTPFCISLAIAFAGRLAADFGAQVIRVVHSTDGDPLASESSRLDGVACNGQSLRALQRFLCSGKELIDFSTAGERCRTLSNSDAALASIALRYCNTNELPADLRDAFGEANSAEVVFSALGDSMVDAEIPTSELTIAALSGLLDLVGRSDQEPLRLGGHQIGYSAGLSGFLALTTLLSGGGIRRADVSALDTALWINWKALAAAAQGRPVPRRSAERGPWRTLPCADGYVALVYFDRDWPALCEMVGDPTLKSNALRTREQRLSNSAEIIRRLGDWFSRQTRAEIAASSKKFGLPLGPVWTPTELLKDPQCLARAFFQPVVNDPSERAVRPRPPVIWMRSRARPGRGAKQPASGRKRVTRGPLAGVRVMDLGIITAGASTSAILADLGADVIKIESPTYLDPFRGTPGTSRADGWWNESDAFKFTNRNKRGACLDLKTDRGRDLFLRLVENSDVVVENFRRGVMQRLGIGYEVLSAVNERIIVTSVSGQGESGPDACNVSFGSTLEATSGVAALTAYEDGIPLVTGMDLNYPDQVVSLFAASATIAALRDAERSGQGTHLDISQRELATYLLGEEIIAGRGRPGAEALGNAAPEYVIQGCFAARDKQWIALSIEDYRKLHSLPLAIPDETGAGTGMDVAAVKNALRAWISARSRDEIWEQLRARGIAAAPVLSADEAWARFREGKGGAMALAQSRTGGIAKGFPFQLPQQPLAIVRDAPKLGEHTRDVLREVLRLDERDIEALERDGVIGTRPVASNAARLD